jgi:tetratricopeptide (TPR) repeat protein
MAMIGVLAMIVASFSRSAPATSSTRQVGSRPASPAPGAASTQESLVATIALARNRLRAFPADQQSWTELGSAYLHLAEITGDPTYFPRAEGALKRSLALDPADNADAMTELGALANARLDFAQALGWARRAAAVTADAGSAYVVMTEALTRLGDYPAAAVAVRRMLQLQPSTTAFIRTAEYLEERGDNSSARGTLLRALASTVEPADLALCRYHLGQLTFNEGHPGAALRQYQLGLLADPDSDPLLAGRAKAEVALGRTAVALHDYATVTRRTAQPQYILENAELLVSLGRDEEAQQQLADFAAAQQRLTLNGVADDLLTAVQEADHGSATAAVRQAQAEWRRRKGIPVADALGWALHRAGRDREAFGYATRANRVGRRNATYRYHLGMIELALGHRAAARLNLEQALRINPYFSVLQAPVGRRALVAASR